MAIDDHTYGFEKQDAQALLRHVGGGDVEYVEGRVRGGRSAPRETAVFVSHASGIAARSGATLGSATCARMTVSGGTRASAGSSETVYNNFLSAITGSVDIVATKVDGIWLVIAEDCS